MDTAVSTAQILGEPAEFVQPLAQTSPPLGWQERGPAHLETAEGHHEGAGVTQGAEYLGQLRFDSTCRERTAEGVIGTHGHERRVGLEGHRLVELPLPDVGRTGADVAQVEIRPRRPGQVEGGGEPV